MSKYGTYYLLDTDILLRLLENNTNTTVEEKVVNKHVNCSISTITWFEVLKKINSVENQELKQIFLDFLMEVIAPNIKIISFDEHAALFAADIANNNRIKNISYIERDLMQLAISISNNLILVTNKKERYEKIKSNFTINVEQW